MLNLLADIAYVLINPRLRSYPSSADGVARTLPRAARGKPGGAGLAASPPAQERRAGLVIIVLFVLIAVFAPLITPYDPTQQSWTSIRKPPSLQHWFGTDESGRDLDYGNGGYFTGNENSAVYKINAINEGARSPSASATATPDTGVAPLSVTFSSEGSSDPDAGDSIVSYAWDFQNDGTVDSTEPNPTFVYTANGVYDARLTVTDSTGRTGVATAVVTVGNTRPVVEIELPPNGAFFEFGDSVRVKVNVTDPEDGAIDCSR